MASVGRGLEAVSGVMVGGRVSVLGPVSTPEPSGHLCGPVHIWRRATKPRIAAPAAPWLLPRGKLPREPCWRRAWSCRVLGQSWQGPMEPGRNGALAGTGQLSLGRASLELPRKEHPDSWGESEALVSQDNYLRMWLWLNRPRAGCRSEAESVAAGSAGGMPAPRPGFVCLRAAKPPRGFIFLPFCLADS